MLRIAENLSAATLKLDPAAAPTGYHQLFDALYGSLLHKIEDGSYEPSMASKAEIVDPQTITIELRPNLEFTDGTPLDAEALKFNLFRFATSGNRLGMRTEYAGDLQSIDVTSPTAATIHLKAPTAGVFYDLFSGPEFSMLSPTAIKAGQDMNTQPVGAGPFMLEQLVPDQKMVLTKNPGYFNADEIMLAGIEYVQVGQVGPAVVNALQTEAVDLAPLNYELGRSLGDPITVESFKHPGIFSIETCKKDAPLSDLKVRQALMFAVDRTVLGERLYGPGNAEATWGMRRKGTLGYNPDLEDNYAHDVAKAKQLLTEAGYPDGFSTSMIVAPGLSSVAGEVLQAQWKEIGVDLSLQEATNVVQDFYLDGKAPMFPIQNTRYGIDIFTVRYLPGAFANVCQNIDPELEQSVRDLMAVGADTPEADAGWQHLSQLTADKLPILPLVFHVDVYGYNTDRVGGLTWHLSEFAAEDPDVRGRLHQEVVVGADPWEVPDR